MVPLRIIQISNAAFISFSVQVAKADELGFQWIIRRPSSRLICCPSLRLTVRRSLWPSFLSCQIIWCQIRLLKHPIPHLPLAEPAWQPISCKPWAYYHHLHTSFSKVPCLSKVSRTPSAGNIMHAHTALAELGWEKMGQTRHIFNLETKPQNRIFSTSNSYMCTKSTFYNH